MWSGYLGWAEVAQAIGRLAAAMPAGTDSLAIERLASALNGVGNQKPAPKAGTRGLEIAMPVDQMRRLPANARFGTESDDALAQSVGDLFFLDAAAAPSLQGPDRLGIAKIHCAAA